MEQNLRQTELNNWLTDKATKKIRQRARERIAEIAENWASGKFATTDGLDAFNRGFIQGIQWIFDIESDEIGERDEE